MTNSTLRSIGWLIPSLEGCRRVLTIFFSSLILSNRTIHLRSFHPHTDLKPENVLICIDDVESIIQAELAAAAALASASSTSTSPSNPGVLHNAPTKLVGVPPSRGRGGNQTPRSESVFITGSQPLPSPSSSYGASPGLDKWAFGMSKIDDGGVDGSKPGSLNGGSTFKAQVEDAVEDGEEGGEKKRGLSAEMDSASERISKLMKDDHGHLNSNSHTQSAGPSLLSQQAPPRTAPQAEVPSISSSSRGKAGLVDGAGEGVEGEEGAGGATPARASVSSGSSMPLDGTERITVKIADLGNGAFFRFRFRFESFDPLLFSLYERTMLTFLYAVYRFRLISYLLR